MASASRNIATKYLKELTAVGVLEQRKEGREVLYLNTRFLDLLKSNEHDFKLYPIGGGGALQGLAG